MMTIAEKIEMYKEKKAFVENIAMAFIKCPKGHTVENITYELYQKEYNNSVYTGTYFYEFIVVHFKGGAQSPVCVSGNSNIGNFNAISKVVDGGYYEEENYYQDIKNGYDLVVL